MALNTHIWAMDSSCELWKARITEEGKIFTFCSDKQEFEKKKCFYIRVSGEKKNQTLDSKPTQILILAL